MISPLWMALACKPALAPSDTDDTVTPGGTLLGIGVAPRDPVARVGETVDFFATAYFENTTYENVTREVTWTVSESRVAEISTDGILTALSEGTTEVVATDATGKGNQVTLTVVEDGTTLDDVDVAPAAVSLNIGDNVQLSATATYSDGTTGTLGAACRWESADGAVATVDPAGRVSGVAAGEVDVTASCSGFESGSMVTVVAENVDLGEPDLVPVGAGASTNGLDVAWTLQVRNDGTAAAQGFYVDAYLADPAVPGEDYEDTEYIGGLAPGESVSVTLQTFDTAAGTYDTVILVDPEDYVVESSESNNESLLSVETVTPALGPDLVINHFFAFNDTTSVEYLLEIENTGDLPAEDFYIDIFTDRATAPETCHDVGEEYQYIALLEPGEVYTWDPILSGAPSGADWTSWAALDLCEDVDEAVESDNILSYTVHP